MEEEMRTGRPPVWRDTYRGLTTARDAEGATEAIGALRELLALEDMIVAPNTPLIL